MGHCHFSRHTVTGILTATVLVLLAGCASQPTRYETPEPRKKPFDPAPSPPTTHDVAIGVPKRSMIPLSRKPITYNQLVAKGGPWTWIWQYTGKPLSGQADIHVLDGYDHSIDDYRYIINKGSYPVAYFSCSYESWRPDAKQWQRSDKGKKMAGWDELWPAPGAIKDHNSNIWKMYEQRLDYFLTKSRAITPEPWTFAIEWDNVDLYDSIGLGRKEGLRFLRHLKHITEKRGLIFILKNSVEVIDQLPDVKMYVNESGQKWNEIHYYKNVGKVKPVLNVEYQKPKHFPDYVYTIYYPNQNKIDGRAITYR